MINLATKNYLLPLLILLVAGFGLSACSASASRQDQEGGNYNVVDDEEIDLALEKRPLQNAHELIEYLRPRYLTPRAQQTVSQGVIRAEPIVYVNGVRLGMLDELYNISAVGISKISYLRGKEAAHRYGMGHEGGAILISTR